MSQSHSRLEGDKDAEGKVGVAGLREEVLVVSEEARWPGWTIAPARGAAPPQKRSKPGGQGLARRSRCTGSWREVEGWCQT